MRGMFFNAYAPVIVKHAGGINAAPTILHLAGRGFNLRNAEGGVPYIFPPVCRHLAGCGLDILRKFLRNFARRYAEGGVPYIYSRLYPPASNLYYYRKNYIPRSKRDFGPHGKKGQKPASCFKDFGYFPAKFFSAISAYM